MISLLTDEYRERMTQMNFHEAVNNSPQWNASLSAHHSFAMYDTKIVRTLTGRLVQFVPGANHAQLIFEVLDADGAVSVDANGEPVLWGVETGPAAQIARRGVTLEHFAVGTVMTVTLNPLRDGRNFGALAREGGHVIHCGAQLPPDGCTASTGTVFLADR